MVLIAIHCAEADNFQDEIFNHDFLSLNGLPCSQKTVIFPSELQGFNYNTETYKKN